MMCFYTILWNKPAIVPVCLTCRKKLDLPNIVLMQMEMLFGAEILKAVK